MTSRLLYLFKHEEQHINKPVTLPTMELNGGSDQFPTPDLLSNPPNMPILHTLDQWDPNTFFEALWMSIK
jgi:hypothetical protein